VVDIARTSSVMRPTGPSSGVCGYEGQGVEKFVPRKGEGKDAAERIPGRANGTTICQKDSKAARSVNHGTLFHLFGMDLKYPMSSQVQKGMRKVG